MKSIQLWSIDKNSTGGEEAKQVQALNTTEAEQRLEDLLVESPGLLQEDLTLVGLGIAPVRGACLPRRASI